MVRVKNLGKVIFMFSLLLFVRPPFLSARAYDYDNQRLIERVQNLENEVAALKAKISAEKEGGGAPAAVSNKPVVVSNVPIEVYGFFKTDAVYNDSNTTDNVDCITFDAGSGTKADHHKFNISARTSRLGFNLKGISIGENGILKGKAEVDFTGMDFTDAYGTVSHQAGETTLYLDRAFVSLNYPKWGVFAGEMWDFFSPLNPSMLNFSELSWSGNLGMFRHGAVYLANKFGKVNTKIGIVDSRESSQESSGHPCGASYIDYQNNRFYLGVGGLYGSGDKNGDDADMWIGTIAWKYKLTERIRLIGEGYYGSNMSKFEGGGYVGHLSHKGIRGMGGWAQVSVMPLDRLILTAGGGIDDVLSKPGLGPIAMNVWDVNYSFFANMKVLLSRNVIWGLEFQRLITKYLYKPGGDANRYQSSLIYRF